MLEKLQELLTELLEDAIENPDRNNPNSKLLELLGEIDRVRAVIMLNLE